MPERGDEQVVPTATAPRRWPSILVTLVVVFALSLTGFLFFRDRQNAAAATASRANAAQDALALASVQSFARAMDLDASMRRAGVVGLRAIGVRDFQSLLVAPLGGALEVGPNQWTLALNGGWACLTWLAGRADSGMATASLGECTDNAPIVSTSGVTPAQFRFAEARMAREQLAALDAAGVAAAISSTAVGPLRFTLPELATSFARLSGVPFRSWPTMTGVTVAASTSAACLQPTASDAQVRVTLGPCR